MRPFFYYIATILLTSSPISEDSTIKFQPSYYGVEPVLAPYVEEYKKLALEHNVKFTHEVTIGFTKIKESHVIGLTTRAPTFREIDIDVDFFNSASEKVRKVLLFHELVHAYCDRDHDFDDGTPYDPPNWAHVVNFKTGPFWIKRPGYYLDGCPTSIMQPVILTESCITEHESDLMNEMFNRCDPY